MQKPGIKMLLTGLLLMAGVLYSYARQLPADTVACSITHYTDEDGLPQNSVKGIIADEYGFIWFTTEDGLVRFDGRRFLAFTGNNTGIRSSRFNRIVSDADDHSLYVMSSEYEWLRIKNGKAFADSSLAGTKEKRDDYYRRITGQKAYWSVGLPDINRSFFSDTPYLVHTGKRDFYICTQEKVSCYENERLVKDIPFSVSNIWTFFPIDGYLFYLDARHQPTGFTSTSATGLQFEGDILRNPALTSGKNIDVFWDRNHPTVLLYLDGAVYQARRSPTGNIDTQLILRFNMEAMNVISLYYDAPRQILFVGSADKGLYIVKRKTFTTLVSGFEVPGDVFYAQTVYKEKYLLTPQGIMLSPGQQPVLHKDLLTMSNQDRYGIITDRKGFAWMKGFEHLFRLEPEHLTTVNKWTLPEAIASLHDGQHNTMWIALRSKGLYALDMESPGAQPRFIMPFEAISVMKQEGNILWLGTGNGMFRFNTANKKLDTITGLKGMYIRSIYATAPGQLWVTTYSNGFFLYDNGRLTRFPVDKDNFLSTAHCIIEDTKGFFWISTNKGLFQVLKKDLLSFAAGEQKEVYYYYYDKENGFNTNEFNGGCDPCAVQMANGTISMPSLNGLVLFDPGKSEPLLPDKNIFVDKIFLDNKPLGLASSLEIPRGFKQLRFTVSSPYLGNKKNITFSYALTRKGETPLWLPVEEDGVISFSNLRSGTYTLSIRKMNGFGKDNYSRKDIILHIPDAWYQSAWFFLSVLLLAVLLTYLATRIRVQYIIRNNRLLELKIAERTEKLQQTLGRLQHTQADLQQKAYLQEHLIAAISHDIRTPMKYLVLTLQSIHEGLAKENNSAYIKTAASAKDYIAQLDGTVNNLIQYIKAQKDKNEVPSENFQLYPFIAGIIALHDEPARRRQVNFINEVPASLSTRSSRQLLSIILRNIIDNAVKNTFDGSITITARQTGADIDISIWDTGKGMSDALLKWLNNDEAEPRPGADEAGFSASGGLGLIIVKELSTLLQIRLSAVSNKGEGSVVHLVLPL